jgi:uncharacterized protein YjbI with pentapeptide repeats/lysophospholipase L1-like esterase
MVEGSRFGALKAAWALVMVVAGLAVGPSVAGAQSNDAATNAASVASSSGEQLPYVALGDSVSAGEGLNYGFHWGNGPYGPVDHADYWLGPDTWYPTWDSANPAGAPEQSALACHRSNQAFPFIVARMLHARLTDLACTSAEAGPGLLQQQTSYSSDSAPATPPQLGPAYENAHPKLVTITIGANDIGFASAVGRCYMSPTKGGCENDQGLKDDVDKKLDAFSQNLDEVLKRIVSIGHKSPNGIPLVALMQYYNPFPQPWQGCLDTIPWQLLTGNWIVGVTAGQVKFMLEYLDKLNGTIATVAARFPNVRVINLNPVFDGHRWCGGDPWVYGPQIRLGNSPPVTLHLNNPAPFHPTPMGQLGIGKLVGSTVAKDLHITPERCVAGPNADCTGADLQGVDLNYYDLKGANFEKANLARANLSNANLSDANLTGANLEGATISRSDLKSARLAGANLTNVAITSSNLDYVRGAGARTAGNTRFENNSVQGADLAGWWLSGVSFYGRNVTNTNFANANLSNSNFDRADARAAGFKGANLSYAKLYVANFSGDSFEGADLGNTDLRSSEFPKDNFTGAYLRGASFGSVGLGFGNTNLSGANFSNANMADLNFYGWNLSGMNFSGTNLSGANFDRADARGVNFAGAQFQGARMYVANFSRASLAGARLDGADLRSSDFIGSNMQNSILSSRVTLGRVGDFFGWTNFTETNFRNANLSGVEIKGDWIVGAGTCRTVMPDGRLNNRNC